MMNLLGQYVPMPVPVPMPSSGEGVPDWFVVLAWVVLGVFGVALWCVFVIFTLGWMLEHHPEWIKSSMKGEE
jgi:hypothetical protein